jgi:ABC-type multidrug transport system fused ATPase/permease subunit
MSLTRIIVFILTLIMIVLISLKVLRDNKIEKARQDAILYEKLKKDLEEKIAVLEVELSKKTQELVTAQSGANNAEEINALRALVAKMNEEIEQLRLQVGQVQKEKDDLNVVINASPFFTTPPRDVILNDPVLQVILFMLFLTILLLGILLFTTRRQLFSTDSELQRIFEKKFNSDLETTEKETDFHEKVNYLSRMKTIIGSGMYGSKAKKLKKLIATFDQTINLAQRHVFYLADAIANWEEFLEYKLPEKEDERKIVKDIQYMIIEQMKDGKNEELEQILEKNKKDINDEVELLRKERELIASGNDHTNNR